MILLKIFLSLVIYWAMFNVIAPFAPASFGPLLLTGLAALLSLPLLYVFTAGSGADTGRRQGRITGDWAPVWP